MKSLQYITAKFIETITIRMLRGGKVFIAGVNEPVASRYCQMMEANTKMRVCKEPVYVKSNLVPIFGWFGEFLGYEPNKTKLTGFELCFDHKYMEEELQKCKPDPEYFGKNYAVCLGSKERLNRKFMLKLQRIYDNLSNFLKTGNKPNGL